MRLFVNVILLSVPSLFARDNKLYNSKRLNFRRLQVCHNHATISFLLFFIFQDVPLPYLTLFYILLFY